MTGVTLGGGGGEEYFHGQRLICENVTFKKLPAIMIIMIYSRMQCILWASVSELYVVCIFRSVDQYCMSAVTNFP